MPLDNMANTLRIFTGTRVACAQCHDHPHDRWTRRQLYEMAAFTNNLNTVDRSDRYTKIVKAEASISDHELQRTSQMIRNYVLSRSRRRHVPMARSSCRPTTSTTTPSPAKQSLRTRSSILLVCRKRKPIPITASASAIGSPRPKTLASHRSLLTALEASHARGLIEPIDDLHDDSKATHPELLAYLTQLMKDLHYDMRAYYEVLYNTAGLPARRRSRRAKRRRNQLLPRPSAGPHDGRAGCGTRSSRSKFRISTRPSRP